MACTTGLSRRSGCVKRSKYSYETHLRSGHHQLGKSPHERVQPVRRAVVAVWRVLAHLVLELRIRAHVAYFALLVECRDRLGTSQLASRGADGLVGQLSVDGADDAFDQVAAVVDFGNDTVARKLRVCGRGAARPAVGGEPARAISQHIAATIDATASHHNARLIRILP